jgi:hypothetical protein
LIDDLAAPAFGGKDKVSLNRIDIDKLKIS